MKFIAHEPYATPTHLVKKGDWFKQRSTGKTYLLLQEPCPESHRCFYLIDLASAGVYVCRDAAITGDAAAQQSGFTLDEVVHLLNLQCGWELAAKPEGIR